MTGPAPKAAGVTASIAELAAELKDQHGSEALGIALLLLDNAVKVDRHDDAEQYRQVALLLSTRARDER